MADFTKEIGHFNFGSPSWTNFELLRAFLTRPEPIVGNKKGHTFLDMTFELWLPSADKSGQWEEQVSF